MKIKTKNMANCKYYSAVNFALYLIIADTSVEILINFMCYFKLSFKTVKARNIIQEVEGNEIIFYYDDKTRLSVFTGGNFEINLRSDLVLCPVQKN